MGQFMGNFTLFQYNNEGTEMAAGAQTRMDAGTHVLFLFFLILCVLLCSCSTIKGTARYIGDSADEFVNAPNGRADHDLALGLRFYREAGIYTGEIVTRVHPTANLEGKPTALFVPLGLVQNNRDHQAISLGVSRLVYESFLQEQTFAVLEYNDYVVPYRTEDMLPLAREKGADYLIGGVINQYFDGGAAGDSRFAMQLFVYQVESGDLMWSLHHSGVLPYKPDSDYALFKVKHRMPVNPMSTLIAAVSGELATLIHYWTDYAAMEEKERKAHEESFSGYLDPDAF